MQVCRLSTDAKRFKIIILLRVLMSLNLSPLLCERISSKLLVAMQKYLLYESEKKLH